MKHYNLREAGILAADALLGAAGTDWGAVVILKNELARRSDRAADENFRVRRLAKEFEPKGPTRVPLDYS